MMIPMIVREMDDDDEFDRIRMLENMARKDLSDIEIARILKRMLESYPEKYPSLRVLANALGKSKQWVSCHLQTLEIEELSALVDNWSGSCPKLLRGRHERPFQHHKRNASRLQNGSSRNTRGLVRFRVQVRSASIFGD